MKFQQGIGASHFSAATTFICNWCHYFTVQSGFVFMSCYLSRYMHEEESETMQVHLCIHFLIQEVQAHRRAFTSIACRPRFHRLCKNSIQWNKLSSYIVFLNLGSHASWTLCLVASWKSQTTGSIGANKLIMEHRGAVDGQGISIHVKKKIDR